MIKKNRDEERAIVCFVVIAGLIIMTALSILTQN